MAQGLGYRNSRASKQNMTLARRCRKGSAGSRISRRVIGHARNAADRLERGRFSQVFPARAGFSPERMAGQTACPEELPARARKAWSDTIAAGLA